MLVMRAGEAVEYRPAIGLVAAPEREYTRAPLAAVPPADRERPIPPQRAPMLLISGNCP